MLIKKILTDNPMLDEVVYNIKYILNKIIVKDQDRANDSETIESMESSQILLAIKRGVARFEMFYFNQSILTEFGKFTPEQIELYSRNNESIPIEFRKDLTKFASKIFIETYVETNDYYRTLNGLPKIGKPDFYLNPLLIEEDKRFNFDFTLPITKFNNHQINILKDSGILDELINSSIDNEYMLFLGNNKIDIYQARISGHFDILYLPPIESRLKKMFVDLYQINRENLLETYYSTSYKMKSEYYNQTMSLILISRTINQLIVNIPELYIKREVFDMRTARYFLNSNGIEFFNIIPMKYQAKLVKNMHLLNKYKSTTKIIRKLAEIFDLPDLNIYAYYLFKNHKVDAFGNPKEPSFIRDKYLESHEGTLIIEGGNSAGESETETIVEKYRDIYGGESDNKYERKDINGDGVPDKLVSDLRMEDEPVQLISGGIIYSEEEGGDDPNIDREYRDIYELKFIRAPIGHGYDRYMNNLIPYNDIVSRDKNWNGGLKHSEVYDKILKQDFTVRLTKYISINSTVSAVESKENVAYFLNLFFNKDINSDSINLTIPSISSNASYKLFDSLVLLMLLSNIYYTSDEYPIKHIENAPDMFGDVINKKIYNDKLTWVEEDFAHTYQNRNVGAINKVIGFNLNLDKSKLDYLNNPNPKHGYEQNKYSLSYFGLDMFQVPNNKKFNNIDDVLDVYNNNLTTLNIFKEKYAAASNQNEIDMLNYIYDNLFLMDANSLELRKYNGNIYLYYSDYLSDYNQDLYFIYKKAKELDNVTDDRKIYINTIVIDMVDSIERYIGDLTNLKQTFHFVPSINWSTILQYLSLYVNFFKSYKSYFLDVAISDLDNNKFENNTFTNDKIAFSIEEYELYDTEVNDKHEIIDWETLVIDDIEVNEYDCIIEFISIFNVFDTIMLDGGNENINGMFIANGNDIDTYDVLKLPSELKSPIGYYVYTIDNTLHGILKYKPSNVKDELRRYVQNYDVDRYEFQPLPIDIKYVPPAYNTKEEYNSLTDVDGGNEHVRLYDFDINCMEIEDIDFDINGGLEDD